MEHKPIKRHEALKPLSREHHQGLLLCWKIKMGLRYKVVPERIKKYADWFYTHHLKPHFHFEEKYIFPILGSDHEKVRQALKEHQELHKLFKRENPSAATLQQLSMTLHDHIRFEERKLFNEIEKAANSAQLKEIQKFHQENEFQDNTEDQFWLLQP
ncbi:MAG: hemerythrin domain-containing protein [Fulvivirga sp.]|nr:hemerythrin domain-containing protein [Fulvivirga sp.]